VGVGAVAPAPLFRIFIQMKNDMVMKAVLNYVGEVVVLGTIMFVGTFVYLWVLQGLGV